MKKKNLPLGLRLNNPLNIRPSKEKWQGQVGNYRRKEGDAFCVFESMEYGYRAAFRLLYTYNSKYKLYTLKDIINRWAPPTDGNDTATYIRRVCGACNMRLSDRFTIRDDSASSVLFVKAMAEVECGCEMSTGPIWRGYYLAFPDLKKEEDIPDYFGILPKGGES